MLTLNFSHKYPIDFITTKYSHNYPNVIIFNEKIMETKTPHFRVTEHFKT